MPRHLFGDVVRPSISMGNRMRYTVPLTMLLQLLLVASLVIAPLMAVGALPSLSSSLTMVSMAPPPPPPPPPLVTDVPPERPQSTRDPNAAPVEAPIHITPETDLEQGLPELPDVAGTAVIAGDASMVVTGLPPSLPPPPPAPVRVGGQIQAPARVLYVNPVYPLMAQSIRLQGLVIIEATIGPDGLVSDARVLRSVPLLDAAAIEAVRQWRYTPTLLNGVPVPVVMTVTVRFSLQ